MTTMMMRMRKIALNDLLLRCVFVVRRKGTHSGMFLIIIIIIGSVLDATFLVGDWSTSILVIDLSETEGMGRGKGEADRECLPKGESLL